MKKIYILPLLLLFTLLAIADVMSPSGYAGKTSSPGENDCTGCHTQFAVNSGMGTVTITSPNLTNWEYVLGQTYQIDVTVSQLSMPLFGFGFEALKTSDNKNGGALGIIAGNLETQLKAVTVSGSSRTNVVHKNNAGLTNDTHTFSFKWTAPATNLGNIKFYAAGNATDDQGDSLGDYVYTTSQLVVPFTTGISEVSATGAISVYPNPAHDVLNINVGTSSSYYNFELMDVSGKLILTDNRKSIVASTPVTIQLPNDLGNGVYFLKAIDENNKSVTTKIFVYN